MLNTGSPVNNKNEHLSINVTYSKHLCGSNCMDAIDRV